MSPRLIRRLCYLAALGLMLGSGGWSTYQVHQGIAPPELDPATRKPKTLAAASQRTVSEPTMSDFAPLWNKRLRRPLVDPVITAPVGPPAAGPPLNVNLLGTIVEPGRSAALLSTGAGKIELKHVGESLGGAARLQEVHRDRAVLQIHNQQVELRLPAPKDQP